jgi:hypothetical protein
MDSKVTKKRPLPTVVTLGDRRMISTQAFYLPLVADYLTAEGLRRWVTIREISKFVYGRGLDAHDVRVRGYLWRMKRACVERGHILICEESQNGRATGQVKVADMAVPAERQLAEEEVKRMADRSDVSEALYAKAIALLGNPDDAPQLEPQP